MQKLTYRGVPYSEKALKVALPTAESETDNIIYRGNSVKGKINPKFPWLKYIKQLFGYSESRPIFDPITLWYNHKRLFLEDCLHNADVEQLERCWTLTLKIELGKTLEAKPKTKLKYRGVTYYH